MRIRYHTKKPTILATSKIMKDVFGGRPLTIVAYGDSWTRGASATGYPGTTPEDVNSFSTQLGKFLSALNPNTNYINSGKDGGTSLYGVENFNDKVLNFNPNYLILNFGINDWGNHTGSNAIPLPEYISNMQNMIDRAKAIDCEVILWVSGVVSTTTKSYGYSTAVDPMYPKYHPIDESSYEYKFMDYVRVLENLAKDNDLMLVDVRGTMDAYYDAGNPIKGWFSDSIHLKQVGHDFIFKVFKDKFLAGII